MIICLLWHRFSLVPLFLWFFCCFFLTYQQIFSAFILLQGHFDILSLTGSYTKNDAKAPHGLVGCLNVTLSGPDGRVIGGGVEAVMLASSAVQVALKSFNSEVRLFF